MRLRRETGDFSIVFDDTTECQIRKGLAPEDLIGAVIQNGIRMGVVTGTRKDAETGVINLGRVTAADSAGDTFAYNPVTGIVKYTKNTDNSNWEK